MRLQIWDTAGQERFRSLTPSYVKNAKALIFVYDVTRKNYKKIIEKDSLEGVEAWIKEALDVKQGDPKLFVIGNKIDLASERQAKADEGRALASKYEADFFEVSALTGEHVASTFAAVGKKLLNIRNEGKKEVEGSVLYKY
eukprot:TRINITY_DN9314_c0_g2_i1.p1 TRINITY_DN9314_c0_g2~~TRINITY_DN9314_c0_g2_i1.p1  ORF type:complete len:141 (+),score=41.39 TRINITY_DN9314_c0_g2_i1:98-520(+)